MIKPQADEPAMHEIGSQAHRQPARGTGAKPCTANAISRAPWVGKPSKHGRV